MARARRTASRRTPARVGGADKHEPSLAPAFDGLLRSARGIARERDPLQAEGFASSIISTFPRELYNVEDTEAFFGQRLVDHLVAKRTDDALAIVHAIAAVASSEKLRRLARAGALRLRVAGRTEPAWAAIIGKARFVEAWTPVDPFEEQDLVVATFEYPDRSRHALVVLVDQNFDGLVRQASVAADPDEVRRAFVESGEMALKPLDAQQVADRLAQGVAMFEMSIDPPSDEDVPALIPLLRSRLDALPPARLPEPRAVDEDERRAILEAFAASKEAGRSGIAVELGSYFLDCRLARLDADPFRWSPIAVEMCLLDWLPRKATLDVAEIRAVPDALKRWVRYSGRRKGMAAELVDETLAAVDQFASQFRSAMKDRSRFGPAKSIVEAMNADGIDPTDPDSVRRWIEDFNARPIAERDAVLGWSTNAAPEAAPPTRRGRRGAPRT